MPLILFDQELDPEYEIAILFYGVLGHTNSVGESSGK
jgi:hypothetical protein